MRRVFLGGQVVSLLGDGLAILAIPLLVLQLTGSPLAAGLASAIRSVGYLVVGIPAGPIVDRVTAWKVLVAADVVRAASFTGLGVMALLHVPQVALILAVAFVSACASVFFDAALAVTVQDVFPRERLMAANSAIETASQMSRVIGPVVAGVLATSAGIQDALWIDAATFVVSLLTVGFAVRPWARPAPRPGGGSRHLLRGLGGGFAAGIRYLRGQRLILTLTVLFGVTNLCLGADTLLVYFGRITMRLSPITISLVIAAGGAAGVAGAVTAPRLARRLDRVRIVTASIMLAGIAVTAMALTRTWWQLAVANAALLFAASQASLLVRAIRQELVPREMLGRVTAAVRTIFVSATPIGSLIASAGTQAAGSPRPAFAAAGALLIVCTVIAWRAALRHHAAGRSPAAARPAPTAEPVTSTGDGHSTT